ncbi:MAG: hypothetical protein RDV48_06400 [Candidatus Eremiobacteraeota bacterium]|nr:hypothetical protein [Candidatus Eremiobacteraeota bacterium]
MISGDNFSIGSSWKTREPLNVPSHGMTEKAPREQARQEEAQPCEEAVLSEAARKSHGKDHHHKSKHGERNKPAGAPSKPAPQAPLKDHTTGASYVMTNGGKSIALFADAPAPGESRTVSTFVDRYSTIAATCGWCTMKDDGSLDPTGKSSAGEALGALPQLKDRAEELASDPAKGKKITPGSIEEAAVGAYAEACGVVPPTVTREATGAAEFIDGKGAPWDVKSPLSPPQGARWSFDAPHILVKLRHDLGEGEGVLLNLSNCNKADADAVINLIKSDFSNEERSQVRILVNREALAQ